LIASGVSSSLAYLSVFIDKADEITEKKKEINKAFGNKKKDLMVELEDMEMKIQIM
jgi:hypothetical protein